MNRMSKVRMSHLQKLKEHSGRHKTILAKIKEEAKSLTASESSRTSPRNLKGKSGSKEKATKSKPLAPLRMNSELSDNQSQVTKSARENFAKKKQDEEQRRVLAYKQLQYGQVFLKYGRFGFPKQKHVFFDGKAIRWRPNTQEGHKQVEKSSQDKSKKCVSLFDSKGDIQFSFGRTSKALKQFTVDEDRQELSFTISAKTKSGKQGYELSLQASTQAEMLQFVDNLQIVMKDFQPKTVDNQQNIYQTYPEVPEIIVS